MALVGNVVCKLGQRRADRAAQVNLGLLDILRQGHVLGQVEFVRQLILALNLLVDL